MFPSPIAEPRAASRKPLPERQRPRAGPIEGAPTPVSARGVPITGDPRSGCRRLDAPSGFVCDAGGQEGGGPPDDGIFAGSTGVVHEMAALQPRVAAGGLGAKVVGPPCHRTPGLPLKAGSACTSGDDRDT